MGDEFEHKVVQTINLEHVYSGGIYPTARIASSANLENS